MSFERKIKLVKLILENNHLDILQTVPDFFTQLGEVKKYRDLIAHNPLHYERDENEKNARMVFTARKVKDYEKLTEKKMRSVMKTVESCTVQSQKIYQQIANKRGASF